MLGQHTWSRLSGLTRSTGIPDTPTLPTATPWDAPQNVNGINSIPALSTASAVACPILPVQLFTMIGGLALVAFMHAGRLVACEGVERRKACALGAGDDSDDMIYCSRESCEYLC